MMTMMMIATIYLFRHMKIYYYYVFIIKTYNLGFSFLSSYKAKKET